MILIHPNITIINANADFLEIGRIGPPSLLLPRICELILLRNTQGIRGSIGLVGHLAVGAVGVAVAVDHVVVVLVLFDELHAALDAVELDVEVDGLQVTDESFLAHEGDCAHVALVHISAEVLFAQMAF